MMQIQMLVYHHTGSYTIDTKDVLVLSSKLGTPYWVSPMHCPQLPVLT